jgi:hypothetical protein
MILRCDSSCKKKPCVPQLTVPRVVNKLSIDRGRATCWKWEPGRGIHCWPSHVCAKARSHSNVNSETVCSSNSVVKRIMYHSRSNMHKLCALFMTLAGPTPSIHVFCFMLVPNGPAWVASFKFSIPSIQARQHQEIDSFLVTKNFQL